MAVGHSPCCRHPVTVGDSVGSLTLEKPSSSRYTCCPWIRSELYETPMSTQRGLLLSRDLASSLLLAPLLSTNTRDSTVCPSTASLPGSSTRRSILLHGHLCPGLSARSARGLGAVRGQVPAAAPRNRDCWDHPSPLGQLPMG